MFLLKRKALELRRARRTKLKQRYLLNYSSDWALDLVVTYKVYSLSMKDKLQIRDVVKSKGLNRETLRFYEQKGLLPKPNRTDAGYREYDKDIISRLKFIKLAQEVGLSLKEISELLSIGKNKSLSRSDLKKIADEKISALDERIRSLKAMKKLLRGFSDSTATLSKKSDGLILSQFRNLEL